MVLGFNRGVGNGRISRAACPLLSLGVSGRQHLWHIPYLLPNPVAAVAILLPIARDYLSLEETNPRVQLREVKDENTTEDERTPLQRNVRRVSAIEHLSLGHRKPSFIARSMPMVNEPSFNLKKSSLGTIYSIKRRSTTVRLPDRNFDRLSSGDEPALPSKVFNRNVILLIIALVILCYHRMVFSSLLPICLLDQTGKSTGFDLKGGLGCTVHDVGVYMSVNGLTALVIQALIFPIFVEKVGVWNCVVFLTILYPSSYLIMPFLSVLPKAALPVGIYATLTLQNFFAIIFYPCALIPLKNATQSSLVLGRVNGLAMSACSGARTVAPPLVGYIYSPAGSAVAWWSWAAFAALAIVELYSLPPEKMDNVVVENLLQRNSKAKADEIHVEEAD